MDKSDIDFLVDLATRFYIQGQTQAHVARELGVDPATISRNLKKARDQGIVRIESAQFPPGSWPRTGHALWYQTSRGGCQ